MFNINIVYIYIYTHTHVRLDEKLWDDVEEKMLPWQLTEMH